jgi:predicted metal-dependent hydrolase
VAQAICSEIEFTLSQVYASGQLSKKTPRIAKLIEECQGQHHDAHYLGYFRCFNEQLFYEAHDVLEELWLTQRRGPNDAFYKGLIQLAGAFVHLQKNRLRPAGSLFKLCRTYLSQYPGMHADLDVKSIMGLIESWLADLEASDFTQNPLNQRPPPALQLLKV